MVILWKCVTSITECRCPRHQGRNISATAEFAPRPKSHSARIPEWGAAEFLLLQRRACVTAVRLYGCARGWARGGRPARNENAYQSSSPPARCGSAGEERGGTLLCGPRRVPCLMNKCCASRPDVGPMARCQQAAHSRSNQVDQLPGHGLASPPGSTKEAPVRCPCAARMPASIRIEAVLHRYVSSCPGPAFGCGCGRHRGDGHTPQNVVLVRHIIELCPQTLADLIDRPPRDLFHVERVGLENTLAAAI